MAYGQTTELDVAASTTDSWTEANALDLLSAHNSFVAVLIDGSKEPGGDFQFMQSNVAEGNQFKCTLYGQANTTVDGVTRANQATSLLGANIVLGGSTANVITNTTWAWSHYQGSCNWNYEDKVKNSGKSQMINMVTAIVDQVEASFYRVLGTDLWDGVAGSIDKCQSVNHILAATSGIVGGLDVGDAANDDFMQAKRDTTTETFNWQTFDTVMLNASQDTGKPTGIRKHEPDVAFMPTALYAKGMQDLKSAGRIEVDRMVKGGGKYIKYAGGDMRVFRETNMTAGTVAIINSNTWTFRYNTLTPEWVTPGFIPVPGTPALWTRGANWFVGLGCRAVFYNGYLSNKSA